MAQAIFHEHPLDEYLKEFGDQRERIPGSFTDPSSSSDDEDDAFDVNVVLDDDFQQVQISSLEETLEVVHQWIHSLNHLFPSPIDDFAERFKYDLISSTLLSISVAPSPINTHVRSVSPPLRPFPGELQVAQQEYQKFGLLSGGLALFAMTALWREHRATAILALLLSLVFAKAPSAPKSKYAYIPQTLECLESLKASGNSWDNAVNDAVAIIEKEERSGRYTPSSSLASPSAALRIALQSTLLTTQQQCDNVRPLLSALASPSELSQLSEMYAPSSPIQTSFNPASMSPPPRLASYRFSSSSENAIASGSGTRLTTSLADKRRTWNGAQAQLRDRLPQSPTLLRKRDHRKSDMYSLLNGGRASPSSLSTPPRSPLLSQVVEDDEEMQDMSGPAEISLNDRDTIRDSFGTAALYLRRKRRASGAELMGLSTSRSAPILHNVQARSPRSSMSSSRFTSLSSSRYPFSLSALKNALHGALSSRRYACAHLLALRFQEDADDDGYWENVRSVASLLTSSFEDGAHRLNAAIADSESQTQRDSEITPDNSPRNSIALGSSDAPISVPLDTSGSGFPQEPIEKQTLATRLTQLLESSFTLLPASNQFAPGPNLIARFSSHVEGMSSSMGDAREHLTDCVKELQTVMSREPGDNDSEQELLDTYDRFRHELGILLRECERGKSVLLDVMEARRRQARGEEVEDDIDTSETSPVSTHVRTHPPSGSSKDSYDHVDLEPLTPTDGSPLISTLPEVQDEEETHEDDASHLLLLSTTAEHLPPAGLEQIYEAEVACAASAFNRERSKLPREERIKLMRSKRESMNGRGLAALLESDEQSEKSTRSSWGPSTDVVAELKDVIWKVGERRRRMTADSDIMRTSLIPVVNTSPNLRVEPANVYDTDLCTA